MDSAGHVANIRAAIVALGIAASFGGSAIAQPASQPTTRQAAASVTVQAEVRYLQYLPPAYASDPTDAQHGGDGHGWPLVLFLHGSGERGHDLEAVKRHGPPALVAQGHDFPFILLSPQCDEHKWWDPGALMQLLDQTQQALHVDPDRVYVTGLSMGGFATWELAEFAPERFAAVVPICGGGQPLAVVLDNDPHARALPIWAFHGDADPAVPAHRSVEMVEAFRAIGDTHVKLTVYPGVGHNSWTQTYNDPEMWQWLLAQKRQPATQPTTR